MQKKTILCYGDSNTWGYDAETKSRFPYDKRWTSVLESNLGVDYKVINEGLCARTTVHDDPYEGENKNGKRYISFILETHRPIDCIVIMLGTNDLKKKFNASAWDIAQGAGSLIDEILKCGFFTQPAKKIILVAPPEAGKLAGTDFEKLFEGSEKKSKELGKYFQETATAKNCSFIDSAKYIKPTPVDAIHLDEKAHAILAEVIADKVKEII
ncbi:MAG: SGNH/GDSL hydrolase family protein [Spirochaetes bacterium]|nr:SGNH/GDSL hydrolase family protein [Spirochaetota bacterium]